jgi:hypothetical protein
MSQSYEPSKSPGKRGSASIGSSPLSAGAILPAQDDATGKPHVFLFRKLTTDNMLLGDRDGMHFIVSVSR